MIDKNIHSKAADDKTGSTRGCYIIIFDGNGSVKDITTARTYNERTLLCRHYIVIITVIVDVNGPLLSICEISLEYHFHFHIFKNCVWLRDMQGPIIDIKHFCVIYEHYEYIIFSGFRPGVTNRA